MKTKLKLKYYLSLIVELALVLSVIMLFAWLTDNIAGAVFFIVSYTVLWYQFSKNVHYSGKFGWWLSIDWSCVFMSCLVGCIGVLFTLPIKYSLISAVPIALGILWVGCIIADRQDLQKKHIKAIAKFDVYKCTEQELVKRCHEKIKHDVEYYTERCIRHFIKRERHEDMDNIPSNSRKQRQRLKQLLEKD